MQLSEFRLGKVDGKEEFLLDTHDSHGFFDAYLLPKNIDVSQFEQRELYFISGFRRTGKTSFLRYFISRSQPDSRFRTIILFKSDISEDQRLLLSQQVGLTLIEHDSKRMGIAQDFKSAWSWFVIHAIAEMMKAELGSYVQNESSDRFLRMMGFGKTNPFTKVLGFLPRLEGAKVRISGETGLFGGEVNLNFEKEKSTTATVLFSEVVAAVTRALMQVEFTSKLVIGIDEIEVFYHQDEQYARDLSMVRDLIFAIDRINGQLRSANKPILLVAAIRREVVDAIGVLGQEVSRVVHDRGVSLTWHHSRRSLNHPLIEMIRRKMRVSLPEGYSSDPIMKFFDRVIDGETLDSFLLDRSFYRPRDLIWRLTFAQKAFPQERKFSRDVLRETESEYSAQLWSEVEYELSATFSVGEIKALTSILSGIQRVFFLRELNRIAQEKAKFSKGVERFLEKYSLAEVCETLYSHGALGNDFRTGTTGNVSRNRWVFRGDRSPILDQRMTLNPAIRKALSAVDQRRRGTR